MGAKEGEEDGWGVVGAMEMDGEADGELDGLSDGSSDGEKLGI